VIFFVAGLVFLAICALSLVGLGESHTRVSRLLDDLDEGARTTKKEETATPAFSQDAPSLDTFSEIGFTRSLLALSKVRSLDPYGSPAPAHAESSSSESLHPVRSKTRDRAL
jgi:hypothetical protein